MKKKIELSALLVVVFVCGILTQTYAAGAIQQIKAALRTDVKVMVNGQKTALKDSKGKAVYPIVYNNTTYIPATDSLLKALNVPFEYDSKTTTMYLGAKSVPPTRLIDLKTTQGSDAFPIKPTVDKKVLTVETGDVIKETKTFKFGLLADNITNFYNKIYVPISKKYKTLTFTADCLNANNRQLELMVINKDTGVELFSNKYSTGEMEDVDVDVSGVSNLQIQIRNDMDDYTDGEKFLIIEPTLK